SSLRLKRYSAWSSLAVFRGQYRLGVMFRPRATPFSAESGGLSQLRDESLSSVIEHLPRIGTDSFCDAEGLDGVAGVFLPLYAVDALAFRRNDSPHGTRLRARP